MRAFCPPDLLIKLAREATDEHRSAILRTLELDQTFRLRRAELAARQVARPQGSLATGSGGMPNRRIYDQHHSTAYTPGTLARGEGEAPVADVSVNQAYDGFGLTYKALLGPLSQGLHRRPGNAHHRPGPLTRQAKPSH